MEYNKKKLIDLLLSDKKSNKQKSFETGVSDNMIGRLERGESIPSLESLPIWAKRYKKDINYFFDIENEKQIVDIIQDYKITEVNNDFLFDRLEKQAIKINKLEEELALYRDAKPSYSMPDVQALKVAEE